MERKVENLVRLPAARTNNRLRHYDVFREFFYFANFLPLQKKALNHHYVKYTPQLLPSTLIDRHIIAVLQC